MCPIPVSLLSKGIYADCVCPTILDQPFVLEKALGPGKHILHSMAFSPTLHPKAPVMTDVSQYN